MDVQGIKALRDTKKGVSYMSKNALKVILAQPDASTKFGMRNRFFMILMYDTGGRMQEILDLKLKDLLLDYDIPCVYLTGKGNKVRAVPLMEKTILHLKEYLRIFHPAYLQNFENYLFYTVIKGHLGPMSPDNVAVFIKKYADQARSICPEVPCKVHAHLIRQYGEWWKMGSGPLLPLCLAVYFRITHHFSCISFYRASLGTSLNRYLFPRLGDLC